MKKLCGTCKTCGRCVKDEEEGTAYCMVKSKFISNLEETCDHWNIGVMYEMGCLVAIVVSILGITGLIMLILVTINYYKSIGS